MRAAILIISFLLFSFGVAAASDNCRFGEENWKAEFPTSSADYESTSPGLSEEDLKILREAGASLTYSFEYVPIRNENRFRRIASLVGRLEILTGGGDENPDLQKCVDYCTATLFSADEILTAGHCLTDPLLREGGAAKIEGLVFRHGGEGQNDPGTLYEVYPDALETSFNGPSELLDYAILKLERDVPDLPDDTRDLFDDIGRADWNSAEIAIIGYPLGAGLLMSRRGCYLASSKPVVGVADGPKVHFRHMCSTTKGMSGAPILDELSGRIVGIHTAGGLQSSVVPGPMTYVKLNKGVVFGEIEKSSLLLRGLSVTPVDISTAVEEALTSVEEDIEAGEQRIASLDVSFAVRTAEDVPERQLMALVADANGILRPSAGEQCPVQLRYSGVKRTSGSPTIVTVGDLRDTLSRSESLVVVADRIDSCGALRGSGIAGCSLLHNGAAIALISGRQANAVTFLHELGHVAGLRHQPMTFMEAPVRIDAKVTRAQCASLIQFAQQRRLSQPFEPGE